MKKVLPFLLLGSLVHAGSLSAGTGTTAGSFLKIGVGARPASMGEAFLGLSDDSTAILWNPAGLPQLVVPEVSLMHLSWLEGITYDYLGFAMPLGRHALGAAVTWLNVAPFNSTLDPAAATASAADISGTFAYGFPLTDRVFIGADVKMLNSSLAGVSALGTSSDLGVMVKPAGKSLSLAVLAQNLGVFQKFENVSDPLPFSLRAGLAWRYYDSSQANVFNLAVDGIKAVDNRFKYNVGGEYWILDRVALRGGYKLADGGQDFANETGDLSRAANFTAGAGFKFLDGQVDYAFLPFGELGTTHRLSGSWKFGGRPEKVEPARMLSGPVMQGPLPEGGQGIVFNPVRSGQGSVREWKADLRDPNDQMVKSISGTGSLPQVIAWNGLDGRGKPVNLDRPLKYAFAVRELNGRALETSGPVVRQIRPKDMLVEKPLYLAESGGLMFHPRADMTVGIKEWKLEIKGMDGKILKTISGVGGIPKDLMLDIKGLEPGMIGAKGFAQLQYSFQLKKNDGSASISSDFASFGLSLPPARPLLKPASSGSRFGVKPGQEIVILFERGLSTVKAADEGLLAEVAGVIQKNPGIKVEISGHSSGEGDPTSSLYLSQERADAVLRSLVGYEGVNPAGVSARGYGDKAPGTEKAAVDRRAVILLVKP